MNAIAWLLYFWFMPVFALTTLYFKLLFSLIFKALKLALKTCFLIVKYVKIGINYAIRKVKEHRQRELLKVFFMVLLLVGLSVPAMAADPIEALKEGVSGGIKDFFVSAADSIFEWGLPATNETSQVKDEHGYVVGSVFKIAAYEHDPYESETVQEMRKRTAVIGLFVFVIYVFYGASCVNMSCAGMGWIERAQFVFSETPFDEYRKILIRAFASILFVHYVFKFIIKFNAAVVYQVMYSVIDSIGLTQNHWIMYCMMAICYGAELVFYGMRFLLMDVIAGSDILIGSMYSFESTREFTIETVKYFARITLLQFIVVLLTSFGIAIIDESPQIWQPFEYLALMIVLFVISAIIMLGFSKLFKTAKVTAKFLKYGGL